MPKLNENYLQLKESYLFSEIAHRTAAYSEKHPDKPVTDWESVMLPVRCANVPSKRFMRA